MARFLMLLPSVAADVFDGRSACVGGRKATLHARWLETTKSRKRKKPATEKDAVQVEGVPVVTST